MKVLQSLNYAYIHPPSTLKATYHCAHNIG